MARYRQAFVRLSTSSEGNVLIISHGLCLETVLSMLDPTATLVAQDPLSMLSLRRSKSGDWRIWGTIGLRYRHAGNPLVSRQQQQQQQKHHQQQPQQQKQQQQQNYAQQQHLQYHHQLYQMRHQPFMQQAITRIPHPQQSTIPHPQQARAQLSVSTSALGEAQRPRTAPAKTVIGPSAQAESLWQQAACNVTQTFPAARSSVEHTDRDGQKTAPAAFCLTKGVETAPGCCWLLNHG
eukprot:CAMPEP_0114549600 /NCGR_PEP_ID=MMETSP0114-20121206/5614_1 /TAXON_ID=31324 /ORGANISM="Goniomonas sp, Strain m" /LENGTH=235 /DNA_ID=CAMNT_0001734293 /DNA_START=384 /DNA_END=1087 /DNA_ORIENTATION=+